MELDGVVEQIEERCKAAGIDCRRDDLGEFARMRLELPAGRETRTVSAIGETGIEALANVPFENYRFLDRYAAISSYEDGTIEAYVERAGGGGNLSSLLKARIGLRRPLPGAADEDRRQEEWENKDPIFKVEGPGPIEATLGRPTVDLVALAGGVRNRVSLRLSGLTIDRHDDARRVLDEVSNAFFFELDSLADVPMILSRARRGRQFQPPRRIDESVVRFPATQFDPEPMSLFWYARGASGMPLLQFLAYYQVLEFYFPMYSAIEARRRIRVIVADPAFRPHDDRDIQRVFRASGAGAQGIGSSERSQLRSTIRNCADPDRIRAVVKKNAEPFGKKDPGLTKSVLRDTMNDGDLLDGSADRIYDIRCRIVHTKEGDDQPEFGLLLPFSREADRLGPDISLAEALARQALINGSRPLTI